MIKLADLLNTDIEYLATGRLSSPLPDPGHDAAKQFQTVEKIIEVEKIVEVERQVTVERPVIVEKQVVVEKVIEKPVKKKIYRTKYIRNPIEFFFMGLLGAILGFLLGIIL